MTHPDTNPLAVIEQLVGALDSAAAVVIGEYGPEDALYRECAAALTAGRQALEKAQGDAIPFAWARPDAVDASQDFRFLKIDDFTVPLYTHPQASEPAPYEVARLAPDYDTTLRFTDETAPSTQPNVLTDSCQHGTPYRYACDKCTAETAQQTAPSTAGEREEVIELLKQGAAISRDRGINLDFAKIADRAAALLQSTALPVGERLTPDTHYQEWKHGCDSMCTNITLWIDRCPHCGKPRPVVEAAHGITKKGQP